MTDEALVALAKSSPVRMELEPNGIFYDVPFGGLKDHPNPSSMFVR